MTISASQIQFFLSGGSNNSLAQESIGGKISSFSLAGELNNLFPNITTEQAQNGKIDYRCFYIKNTSESDSIYNLELSISEQGSSGSNVRFGTEKNNEIQKIEIYGNVTFGTASFNYNNNFFNANWESFSEDILNGFSGSGASVQVLDSTSSDVRTITIKFEGDSSNRNHPLLKLTNNSLENSPTISIVKSKDMAGRPINYEPDKLPVDYQSPVGVVFEDDSKKIILENLKPNDFIPVWIKRETVAGTEFQTDYFKFKISGRPFS